MNLQNRLRPWGVGLAAAGLLALAACAPSSDKSSGDGTASSSPREGGSIVVGVGEALTTWNINEALTVTDYQVIKEVFEPLVVNTADGSDIQGALADSFSYDDTRTKLTFQLPANATFTDGPPVTSADVAFSVDLWKKSGSGALYAGIKSVDSPSPTTVIFNLDAPNSALLPLLTSAGSGVVRKDFGGKTKEEYFAHPVGSGPFMVDDYTPGSTEIVLKKNPNYHKEGLPHLDQVTYKVTSDANQRVLQYNSGEIDIYEQVSPDLVNQLPKDEVTSVAGATVSAVTFNVRPKAGITSDVNFRTAVSLALNRKALVDSVYAGFGSVAQAGLTPNVPGAIPCAACNYPQQDVEGAKRALAASDYDGETVELSVDTSNGANVLAAQAIQSMLGDVGIKVSVKPQDVTTLISRAIDGDLQMNITSYRATILTLNDMLSLFIGTGSFFSGEDSGPLLEAAGAVAAAQDEAQQEAVAAKVEKYFFETKYWVPVADLDIIFAAKSRVGGLTVNPLVLYNLNDLYVTS